MNTFVFVPIPLLPWLALLLLASSWQAQADAYYVELQVAAEDRQTQDAAFAEAMRRLLAGLTAQERIWAQPAYADLVSSAWRYVDKFNFKPSASDSRLRTLRCWFKPDALRNALLQRGFVFASEPVETLLWLVEQQGSEAWLMAPDEPGALYSSLPALAQEMGLKLRAPLVDLQERTGFIGNGTEEEANASLVSLSQRYDVGAVLIGRIRSDSGIWRMDWTRIQQAQQTHWSDHGTHLPQLLALGIQRLAGPAPAIVEEVPMESLELAVTNIQGRDDMHRLQAYLQGLSVIGRVRFKASEGAWQVFQIELLGGRDGLLQALSFGGVLEQTAPPLPKQPDKPRVHDPLAHLNLPGQEVSKPKPKVPQPPGRLHFRRI